MPPRLKNEIGLWQRAICRPAATKAEWQHFIMSGKVPGNIKISAKRARICYLFGSSPLHAGKESR